MFFIWFLVPSSGFSLPDVLKSPRWFDLLCACQCSFWEDIFLMSLLSGASLSVGFVIFSSGVSLGVGMTFS
jgi:hypothetical protein